MFSADFKNTVNRYNFKNEFQNNNPSEFTLLLNNHTKKYYIAQYSIINATKPFVNYLSLFGIKLLGYSKNTIHEINAYNKIYSSCVILLLVLTTILINPRSWHYTKTDAPLNILTITFGVLHVYEASYLIYDSAFGNRKYYIDLMKCLDDIDNHFEITKKSFAKNRLISIVLVIAPLCHLACMMSLITLRLQNLLVYLTIYLVMLQGILIIFVLLQIYTRLLMLNDLLVNISDLNSQSAFIYKENNVSTFLRKMFTDPDVLKRKLQSRYCWLELMQIYDKLSDSVLSFNNIYASQIFVMFSTWVLCSLLAICRTLSPSVKYLDVIVSDLFIYSTLNIRPLFLSQICQLLMIQRKKTLSLLVHNIVYKPDYIYAHQIKTMIMLVETRKLEISANVCTPDVASILDYAGRVISYAVLMIQYFYMHVF